MRDAAAHVEKTIHAPITEVWDALTDTQRLKSFFFGAEIETDWKVGSPIKMRGEWKGKPYEDKGSVLADDRYRRLSFTHFSPLSGLPDVPDSYHVVTITLAAEGARDTHVEVVQSNLIGGVKPSDVEHKAEYEKNWATMLEGLARVVTH